MPSISFFGAVRGVTGSCHLLETDAGNILIDCGMFQGTHGEWNHDEFGFDPKEIKAVFVTHPHADHTGRLPKLVKEGYAGKIYMPAACRPLSRLVLEDSAHIMAEEAKKMEKEPVFTPEDVAATYGQVEGVGYHQEINLDGVKIMFHEAGHVLGSGFISIDIDGKRIIFSGDVGNDEVPILPDTEDLERADVVICEATYGDRVHEGREERRQKLKEQMEAVIERKGTLLIPAFSIERTQEILYEMNQILLHDLKTNIPIFLDSPMAIKATQVYRDFKQYLRFDDPILSDPDRDFFAFPNLKETLTKDESKTINRARAPKIIMAGSGMMSGGRIMHHLLHHLEDKKTTVLIVGYQAEGTTGRAIQDGAKHVTIFNEEVEVKATIDGIHSFSAHADRDKLTKWLQPKDGKVPGKVILVHGDPDQKTAFKVHLEKELETEVLVPGFGERIEL